MKVTNAIKKLEKAGMKVTNNGKFYRAEYDGGRIEFIDQMGSAICINSCSFNLEKQRDSQTDYSPECYHDNITQAIRFVSR